MFVLVCVSMYIYREREIDLTKIFLNLYLTFNTKIEYMYQAFTLDSQCGMVGQRCVTKCSKVFVESFGDSSHEIL